MNNVFFPTWLQLWITRCTHFLSPLYARKHSSIKTGTTPNTMMVCVPSSASNIQTLNFGSDAFYWLFDDVWVLFRLVPIDLVWFWDSNLFSWLLFFKFYSVSVSDDIFGCKLLLGICLYPHFYAQVMINGIFYVVCGISQEHLLVDSSCRISRRKYERIFG